MRAASRFLLAVAAGMLGAWLAAPPVARAAVEDARLIMVPDVVRVGSVTYANPLPEPPQPDGVWLMQPDVIAEGAALKLLARHPGPVAAIQVAMVGADKARAWYVGSETNAAALVISRKMIDLLSDPAWRARALGLLAA